MTEVRCEWPVSRSRSPPRPFPPPRRRTSSSFPGYTDFPRTRAGRPQRVTPGTDFPNHLRVESADDRARVKGSAGRSSSSRRASPAAGTGSTPESLGWALAFRVRFAGPRPSGDEVQGVESIRNGVKVKTSKDREPACATLMRRSFPRPAAAPSRRLPPTPDFPLERDRREHDRRPGVQEPTSRAFLWFAYVQRRLQRRQRHHRRVRAVRMEQHRVRRARSASAAAAAAHKVLMEYRVG